MPILVIRKLRLREVKTLAQDHTSSCPPNSLHHFKSFFFLEVTCVSLAKVNVGREKQYYTCLEGEKPEYVQIALKTTQATMTQ